MMIGQKGKEENIVDISTYSLKGGLNWWKFA